MKVEQIDPGVQHVTLDPGETIEGFDLPPGCTGFTIYGNVSITSQGRLLDNRPVKYRSFIDSRGRRGFEMDVSYANAIYRPYHPDQKVGVIYDLPGQLMTCHDET